MKKIITLTFVSLTLIVFTMVNTYGQNFELPLWEKNTPNQKLQKGEIETADTAEMVRITNVVTPDVKVFLPTKKINTGKAVVICPGGGYAILAYDWEGIDVARWLSSNGIAAIVLKYRLPGSPSNIERHLSPMLDAKRAMRLTRYHAEEWGINPDEIGILGFSAGGSLASTAGTHFDYGIKDADNPIDKLSSRPDFMILMYPVITFKDPYTHAGSRENLTGSNDNKELIEMFSNELHVTKDTPPTFIIHSEDDDLVPVENSLMFYDALKKNNVSAEMHIFKHGGHGFSLSLDDDYLAIWKTLCLQWIKEVLE